MSKRIFWKLLSKRNSIFKSSSNALMIVQEKVLANQTENASVLLDSQVSTVLKQLVKIMFINNNK